jgi:two-component sensor histidine kinase
MQPRLRIILVFLPLVSWLLCLSERSLAFDSRVSDSLHRSLAVKQQDTNRIKTLLRLSILYEADSPAKSFYYASEALFLSEKKTWRKGIGFAELRIAIVYIDVWELEEAVQHLHKSIKAARITGDGHTERSCWQYLVHCYDHLSEHQKAFDCQSRLLKMVMETGDTVAICRQMSAYATVMIDAGRKQSGMNSLNEAVRIAEAHLHGKTRNEILAELLNTVAIRYLEVDKKDSTFLALRRAIPLAGAIDDTSNIAYLFSTLCFAHLSIYDYDSAGYYGRKTLLLAEQMKDLPLLKNTHAVLSDIFEHTKQAAKALYHYKAYDSISRLITNSEKTLEQSMQISRVAIQQQQMHREQEKRTLESVNAEQRTILVISVCILVALGIITSLIFRNLKTKEHTNKVIKAQAENLREQNEIIDAALRDKETLLQEMHHRVKNNLQLIYSLLELQITKLKDKNSIEALTATQQRIYSMATVHRRLYHNSGDASVAVHEFVTDLFQSLSDAFSENEGNIQFRDQISVTDLPLNMLVPLGLILNELITNSFKHAFHNNDTGIISLSLQKGDESVIMTYNDTGPGINLDQLDEQSGALGIYLIKRLTRQLKGSMTYSYERGSKFIFTFPL